MQRFDYLETEHLDEVISTLVEYGSDATLLAGGTDLLNMIRTGTVKPRIVINLKHVSSLSGINDSNGELRLRALTKIKALNSSSIISKTYPSLKEASNKLGSIQIRHLATVGGNLCRAAPCAETAPPLLVYGASIRINGPDGERILPLEDFFTGPGEVALKRGEVLTEVIIPAPETRTGSAYLRHSVRPLMDLALVNVAVLITLDDNTKTIKNARIALGSVAPTPMRARRAEEALRDQPISDSLILNAAEIATEESLPISDVRSSADYRHSITRLFARRALETAISRINGGS
jgi:carbon-monoxide dehydrogenase medium subunit